MGFGWIHESSRTVAFVFEVRVCGLMMTNKLKGLYNIGYEKLLSILRILHDFSVLSIPY